MPCRPTRTACLRRLARAAILALGLVISTGARAAGDDASASPAQSATGLVSVTSNIEGARVWIDAVEVGTVPLTRYVPAGSHQLRVAANGYDPFVRRIDAEADATIRVEAPLSPGRGTVEFICQVPGARVFLDDREIGPAPIRLSDVTPGDHTWRMEAPGYEATWEPFTFTVGENLLIPVVLSPSQGLFTVVSDPAGATVRLDGNEVGTTPLDLTAVPAGLHGVQIHLPGRADAFRAVDTRDGSKGEVSASLASRGATLLVRTGRDDASVALNNCPAGTGSRVRVPEVERGPVHVTVQAPGQAAAERQVTVPGSGRLDLRVQLRPAAGNVRSSIETLPPLIRRWSFWAVTGGVAAVGVAGGVALALLLAPEAPPEGDVQVTLP